MFCIVLRWMREKRIMSPTALRTYASIENMAAAMARRVSGVYLQFDIHTFSFHSHNSLNV